MGALRKGCLSEARLVHKFMPGNASFREADGY
jgi:hypothetical protein